MSPGNGNNGDRPFLRKKNTRFEALNAALSFGKSDELGGKLNEDLLEHIKGIFPEIPIYLQDTAIPNLVETNKLIGSGGTSQVTLGEYTTASGEKLPVAIKRFALQVDEIPKISKWYFIIKRLGYVNQLGMSEASRRSLSSVPNILIPIAIVIEVRPYKIELLDISPYCDSRSNFPTDPQELLVVIYELASAFCEMHARSIVHLDIKAANILWINVRSRWMPMISDLGEAVFFGHSLRKVTVSTTLTLILQNSFINSICKDLGLLANEHTNPLGLFHLISFEIPEKYLWLVDNLLFGILLLDPCGVDRLPHVLPPFQPSVPMHSYSSMPKTALPKVHTNPADYRFTSEDMVEYKTLRKCGKELIIHAFLELFPLWAEGQADPHLRSRLTFEQYFWMPPNMSAIRPVKNLEILRTFLRAHLGGILI